MNTKPYKASTNDLRSALEATLKATYGGQCYVQDFDPEAGWVVFNRYSELPNGPSGSYRQGFEVDDQDNVTLADSPTEVEQRTTYVPKSPARSVEYGVANMAPAKAAELDTDEMAAWFEGRIPRRLLAIPFSGPIPAPDGKGRDLDIEYFDERTDIKADWFDERPVDWHHGHDPLDAMNGVLIGKAKRLGTFDGTEGEPDEDGWWVDLWLKASKAHLARIQKLAERGAQLFGSTYAYPNLIKRGKAGHIDVWPYMVQTLSPIAKNTNSAFRSAKAVLNAFDEAEITVSDGVLRQMLAALDDLRDLPAAAANGRLTPAHDLPGLLSAKAGRELSARNQAEIDEWAELLESITSRSKSFLDRIRARYQEPSTEKEVS